MGIGKNSHADFAQRDAVCFGCGHSLEETAERDRQEFAQFEARLAGERKKAEERHDAMIRNFVDAEEKARASMAAVEQQRQQMIQDLSGDQVTNSLPSVIVVN